MKFILLSFYFLAAVAFIRADEDSSEEKTEGKCHEARKKSIANKAHIKIIFECEDEDTFQGLQCFHNTPFCACYSRDGIPISKVSTKLRRCECLRQVDIQSSKGEDVYLPTCEEDGSFTPKQCDSTTGKCWCVDSDGSKDSEPTSGEIDC